LNYEINLRVVGVDILSRREEIQVSISTFLLPLVQKDSNGNVAEKQNRLRSRTALIDTIYA